MIINEELIKNISFSETVDIAGLVKYKKGGAMNMNKKIYLLMFFTLFVFHGCMSAQPAPTEAPPVTDTATLHEIIKNDAVDAVTREVTRISGKQDVFQDINALNSFIAQLDGKGAKEGIAYVRFNVDEELREYYLVIYSLDSTNAVKRIALLKTHDEYLNEGYSEIVDLNKDGRNEILVVGDTEGMNKSDIRLYTLKNGRLKDLIWGLDCGASYFHLDIDGDSREEIVAIRVMLEDESQPVYVKVLSRKQSGYYRETQPKQPAGEIMKRALQEVVSSGQIHRPHTDLRVLVNGIRLSDINMSGFENLQGGLEELYKRYREADGRHIFVEAMSWKGNLAAVPFLKELLLSGDNKETRISAAAGLAIIASEQTDEFLLSALNREIALSVHKFDHEVVFAIVRALLSLDNMQGLERCIAMARDTTVPIKIRRDIVFWVLGEFIYESGTVLYDFALHSSDPEIRRLASSIFSNYFNIEKLNLTMWDFIAGLESDDKNVRASSALALEHIGRPEAIPELLTALKNETDPLPRRQMVYALFFLQAEEAIPLYRKLLETEKNEKIRNLMWALIEITGNTITIDDFLKGVRLNAKYPQEIKQLLKIAADQQLKEAVPHIISLAKEGQGRSVRETAVQALAQFNLPESKEVLRDLIKADSSWAIRFRAIEALNKLEDTQAEGLLIESLQYDPDDQVRCAAAKALGSLNTSRARIALIDNLEYGIRSCTQCYVHAMVATHDQEVKATLAKELISAEHSIFEKHDNTVPNYMLIALADGLYRMGDHRGLKVFKKWLGPGYPDEFRAELIDYFAESKIWELKPVVFRLRNDASRKVRAAAINYKMKMKQ